MAFENNGEFPSLSNVTTGGYVEELEVDTYNYPYSQIVSDEVMRHLTIYIIIIMCGTVAVFGVLSNVCNMVVFHKMGIKDSMSVCLFSLSLTDFLVSCIILLNRVTFIWKLVYKGQTLDPLAFRYIGPVFIADAFFLSSGWILAIMSLERCICVTIPFKVKHIFTRNRSIVAVIVVYAINLSINVPIFMTQRLAWTTSNVTLDHGTRYVRRLIIEFSGNRQEVQYFVGIFTSSAIPIPALAINFVSVLWMIYGLYQSSRTRRSMTHYSHHETEVEKHSNINVKTRKLMKVVLLLAIIFLICSVPRIIAKSVNVILPNVHHAGKEKHVNNLLWQVARLFAVFNASINMFVYLAINSSYREKFQEIFLSRFRK